jgi:hypothetical protein
MAGKPIWLSPTGGWFDLDMGIIVEGERLPLAPLLAGLFRRDARWLEALQLDRFRAGRRRHRTVHTAERQAPACSGRPHQAAGRNADRPVRRLHRRRYVLRLSRFDAPRLAELNDTSRWQFRGQSDVSCHGRAPAQPQGITDIEPPGRLVLELRPYQLEGLAWLQFLREHELSGILADDMGLGKTAQTLAHLLLEKEAGRLDKPALIVLPTSLIFNWKNEAARFAPDLKVLSLHGPERKSRFDRNCPNTTSCSPPIRCCGATPRADGSTAIIC